MTPLHQWCPLVQGPRLSPMIPFRSGTKHIQAPLNKFSDPTFTFLVKEIPFKYQHAYSKVSGCR